MEKHHFVSVRPSPSVLTGEVGCVAFSRPALSSGGCQAAICLWLCSLTRIQRVSLDFSFLWEAEQLLITILHLTLALGYTNCMTEDECDRSRAQYSYRTSLGLTWRRNPWRRLEQLLPLIHGTNLFPKAFISAGGTAEQKKMWPWAAACNECINLRSVILFHANVSGCKLWQVDTAPGELFCRGGNIWSRVKKTTEGQQNTFHVMNRKLLFCREVDEKVLIVAQVLSSHNGDPLFPEKSTLNLT